MTEKSAERRLDAVEPLRVGAAIRRPGGFPPPANDNAPPLLARAMSGVVLAAFAGVAVGLVYLLA